MKNKFRFLIACLFTLILTLSCFTFACDEGSETYGVGLEHFNDYVPEYKTYENITVDGVVNESEWGDKAKISYTAQISGKTYSFEFSADFNEDGFVMYSKVSGGPMFYNYGRGSTANTGLEYYVATSASGEMNMSTTNRNYEVDISAGGYFITKLRLRPAAVNDDSWCTYVIPLDVDTTIHGTLNDPNSTEGWTTEWFMPWYAFDITEPPESIYVLPAYLYSPSKTEKSSTWFDTVALGLGRTGSQGNYAKRIEFTENGYKAPNA